METKDKMNDLLSKAKEIRIDTLKCIASLGVGHVGGCLSIIELLTVLYFKHMNIDPNNPKLNNRDRLIVSKGHSGPAVYATLANRGYFGKDVLNTLNRYGTNLPSHCDMNKTLGVDMTTGSLGQGFSCACGIALGSRFSRDNATIYAIIGDGETQEGQIWEAAMFAAKEKLNNLIAFTDNNGLQIDGTVKQVCDISPLADKWRAFNWNVIVADGHNMTEIDNAITSAKKCKDKPSMIILNTVKGKGVSFIEAMKIANHNTTINAEQLEKAIAEVERS